MLRPITDYADRQAAAVALASIAAYNKEKFMIKRDYVMAPAPEAGLCTGCILYAAIREGARTTCIGAGCQPAENPVPGGGHRVVIGRRGYTRDTIEASAAALARNTDPATSAAAAAKVQVVTLKQAVVNALLAERSLTGKEIADLTGKPLNSITPRFKGLVDAGLIKDTGTVRDGQTVWRLA